MKDEKPYRRWHKWVLHNDALKRLPIQLRNKFFAGVAVAIPTIVTLWVINLVYDVVSGVSRPILARFGLNYPGLPFLITIVLLMIVGTIATNVFGKKIIESFEALILRIPLAASIYRAVKQVMDSIQKFNGGKNFKRVAYVEYPSEGCRLIGFVTGQYFDSHQKTEITTVFIPTAPNPMTGFVIAIDSDKVSESDLALEEASKLILSAGLVGPVREPVKEETKLEDDQSSS